MRKDAGLPFDLMVFDNGSCAEVRDFLVKEKEEGRIQYLILAEKNMGKGGAWNVMLAGAPGEIISYTDSDVLFSPNWLKRSVEILETFPNVGMVTARPFRTPPEFIESTLKWARDAERAQLEEGQFIPWKTFLEFNLSLGQTEEENKKVYAETKDWRIQYKGVTALAGASHWQFTAYKSTLQQFLPFDMDKPMGQVRQLDKRMNDAGLLRLMVSDPLGDESIQYAGVFARGVEISGKKEAGFVRQTHIGIFSLRKSCWRSTIKFLTGITLSFFHRKEREVHEENLAFVACFAVSTGIMSKKIFISADHGMAIIYFLQSDVVPTLLDDGR